MELRNGIATFYASDRAAWRLWLSSHHATENSVWLILYRKHSGTPCPTYDEAVEEALCYGWIDSKPNKRDENSYYLFFAKRKPKSVWSKINKARVEQLTAQGLMAPAGLQAIAAAQKNGSWNSIDDVEALQMPPDFDAALDASPDARHHFDAFPPSSRKIILGWILSAKRPETRQHRIEEAVRLAAQNIRANHYRQ